MSRNVSGILRFASNDFDISLLMTVTALISIGWVMVFSASVGLGEDNFSSEYGYFYHHVTYTLLGVAAMFVLAITPIRIWKTMSLPLLVLSLIVLLLVLLTGVEVNGSKRWLVAGGFRGQPAEAVKLITVLYVAGYLTRRQSDLQRFSHGIVNIGIVLAVVGVLLLLQPDFGTFVVITVTVALMMFLGGIRISHTLLCFSAVTAVMVLLVRMSSYRLQRVFTFMDPWSDPFGNGFQLTQALIAIGRGEVFGVGLGASIQKLYYLPHAHTDFIFAVLGEELGLVGVLVVVTLFVLLLRRAFVIARIAEMSSSLFEARVAQGCGLLLVIQALIHIGVNLGLLPTKGLTLPFISFGGSSFIVSCAAVGFLFAVERQSQQRKAIPVTMARKVR